MRELIQDIDRWLTQGEIIALATVVTTWGSAPRRVGAHMAMTPDGKITGSVSGGCVEGAVFEAGVQVLDSGVPRLLHFGVADDTAWEVGLACGGSIDVFVEALDPNLYGSLRSQLLENLPVASVTAIDGPDSVLGQSLLVAPQGIHQETSGPGLPKEVIEMARQDLRRGESGRHTLPGERLEVFVNVFQPPLTLVMVGGVHIATALAQIAKTLGYQTVVIDPRRSFGSQARFPNVDRLLQQWPEEALADIELSQSAAIAMLTHDPKIDDPALMIALRSPAFYIGALGSRKTQAKRRARLLAAGLTEAQLARLHGPIGVEIGAQTPAEIALAIMAQVVAAQNQSLSDSKD